MIDALQIIIKSHMETRRELSLPLMQPNLELRKAAQWHAEHMANFGFLSHIDKINRGVAPRVKEECNFAFVEVAENIAIGFEPEEVFSRWMNSSISKNIICYPQFTHFAVGYFYQKPEEGLTYPEGLDYRHYYCAVYASEGGGDSTTDTKDNVLTFKAPELVTA